MDITPSIVIIAGLPGGGKSEATALVEEALAHRGYDVAHDDDKTRLENEVLRDVLRFQGDPSRQLEGGGICGEHSILLDGNRVPGTLQIGFIDGNALNRGHEVMFDEAAKFVQRRTASGILVAEVAYGQDKDYPKEPLTQTGTQLVKRLRAYDLLSHVLIYEIISNLHDRTIRNSQRPGHIPTGEFGAIFAEAGHFTPYDIFQFGNHYRMIPSEGTNKISLENFKQLVNHKTETFLIPMLEGRQPTDIEASQFRHTEY